MELAVPHTFYAYGRTIEVFHLKAGDGVPLHKHLYQHTISITRGPVRVLGINRLYAEPTEVVFQAGDEHGFIAEADATVVSMFDTEEAERPWQP